MSDHMQRKQLPTKIDLIVITKKGKRIKLRLDYTEQLTKL